MIARHHTTLGALEPLLAGVLSDLRALDLRRRPFVIVDDPVSRKFVQFARIAVEQPGDRARGIPPLGALAFDVPLLSIYLQGFGDDPAEGARLAVKTLRGWLPDEAALVVTLDGEPLD